MWDMVSLCVMECDWRWTKIFVVDIVPPGGGAPTNRLACTNYILPRPL